MMLCVISYWVLSGAPQAADSAAKLLRTHPAKLLKRRDVYLKLTRHNGRAGTHGTYNPKHKEQIKEKARDSVLQLLNRLQAEQTQRKPGEPHTAEKSETRGDVY